MALNSAGKAMIAIAGFVWGLARTGDSARHSAGHVRSDAIPGFPDETISRLERLEAAVLAASRSSEPVRPPEIGAANERLVTERQMAAAVREAETRLREEISERLLSQALAVESLREMIAGTDALLERVLERLEAFADGAATDNGPMERAGARGRTTVSDLRASGRN